MRYIIKLPNIDDISVLKTSTNRISLSVNHQGRVKIRAPHLVHKNQIINFATQNIEWIKTHQQKALSSRIKLKDGATVGGIKLNLSQSDQARNSHYYNQLDDILSIKLKRGLNFEDEPSQEYIKKILKSKLNLRARQVLEPRLCRAAAAANLKFNGFKVSVMKSRWGSCDSKQNIHLNSLLLLVPDELIEYVIYHELAHTKQMNHSPQFWQLVGENYPYYKSAKLKLKKYKIASLF